MEQTVTGLLEGGRDANYSDKFRTGNVVYIPADAELIATGDIHGHQRNFERITAFAALGENPNRHLLLQEIIHGGPEDALGGCLSYKLLFDTVRLKVQFPDRVHFVMSNHDTAFINDGAVLKNGKEMNRAMKSAISREFPCDSLDVQEAIAEFFLSQPLALRCGNRIWLSHSLPADQFVDAFDKNIFEKKLTVEDTIQPGSAYFLTWGRRHSQQTLDKMAELLDVDIFILGHQRQEEGWSRQGDNLIILSSDHNHGCLLPIKSGQPCTIEQLISSIIPLASIA
jgi:hypothetical protein